MKKATLLLGLFIAGLFANLHAKALNEPDSAYLFAYSTAKNQGRNGLHFAWSIDNKNFQPIGPEFRYLFCDYGRWGSEKRIVSPFLFFDNNGLWHCIWSVNERDGVFAHASSQELTYWFPQSYPVVMDNNNCTEPEVYFDKQQVKYVITWVSTKGEKPEIFGVTTNDFKKYSATQKMGEGQRLHLRTRVLLENNLETGIVHKVAWGVIDELFKKFQIEGYKKQVYGETTRDDSTRFAGLKAVDATVSVNIEKKKKISDLLVGIFFEDINYAADGGIYAELVQNRGFEYHPGDKIGRDKTWNSFKSWSLSDSTNIFTIDTELPVHPNNKHYAVIEIKKPGHGLVNEGFNGIAIVAGDKYDFSVFVRNTDNKSKKLSVRLIGTNGEILGESIINTSTGTWKKYSTIITATKTTADARLEVAPLISGTLALDMISLFPQKTFKNRKNGLRADLAQVIADIQPRFVRFPGGCVAHGDGIDNIYNWKNTIGPLEARKPQRNIWNYHQSMGLGYFEYFQYCEDIGAEPLPVIAAGVPCQNSGVGGAGQQGGIPMCEMDNYVQDILDLIEWANGSVNTKWGKKRAEAGHPKPFNLKYIGIGNEDLITDIFEERFTMIFNAIKQKYPEINVIGTVGPFNEGTDYVEGWKIATKLGVPMVDEHYYQSPGWFIHNQDFYDKYDRSKPKVYLGEYAAHLPGRPNNIETALAEALHLITLERNGDIVSMASYAPLLAKEQFTQWNPNLIYFTNTEVKPTVGYFIQQLFGQNSGDTYHETKVIVSDNKDAVRKRVAASVVTDSKTGDIIVKLVNILPVAVNSQLKLDGVVNVKLQAKQIVVTGKPADRKVLPIKSSIEVSTNFNVSLPPYSFTLLRIVKM